MESRKSWLRENCKDAQFRDNLIHLGSDLCTEQGTPSLDISRIHVHYLYIQERGLLATASISFVVLLLMFSGFYIYHTKVIRDNIKKV